MVVHAQDGTLFIQKKYTVLALSNNKHQPNKWQSLLIAAPTTHTPHI